MVRHPVQEVQPKYVRIGDFVSGFIVARSARGFGGTPTSIFAVQKRQVSIHLPCLILTCTPQTCGNAKNRIIFLCQKIRTRHTYPIIMLTAKDGETDKINGLTLGADDYMTKPFRPLELVARVKSQLRRYKKYNPAQAEAEAGDVMTHAGLEMNVKAHQCLLDGKSLTLTPTEFSILQILLESKGTVVSAEELFYRIWADEYYSKTNNTITSHIRHLREKLNDTMDNPKYIRTIWGVGYKIED